MTFWSCADMLLDSHDGHISTSVTLWGVEYSITNTTTLDLSNSGLTGLIPPEISNLNKLTRLDLSGNQLSGSIPPEISNLNKLTRLDLSGNQLSGSLPLEMGDMTNLNYLDISDNQLSGEIPQSFCGLLPNLEYQDYFYNALLSEGVHFYSSMNQLCPPYPSCIDTYVGEQNLCPCGLDEDSMASLWGYCYPIESTTEINLSNRGLSGSIPSEIGNLINLTSLDLSENQLTGSIPPEIGNLINLTKLDLGTNQLTGSIPPEIGDLINLSGSISSFGIFTSFHPGLDLSENQLTGSIPSEIGDLINLKFLFLGGNQLTGSIPSEIGYLPNLLGLRLNHNQLSGLVPGSICELNLTWYTLNVITSTPISSISSNKLCPPYPGCLSGTYNSVLGEPIAKVGEQDTSDCN